MCPVIRHDVATHLRLERNVCIFMNVSILCKYKGLSSQHCVPRPTYPHELHNGCIIRFFNVVSDLSPAFLTLCIVWVGSFETSPVTAFCRLFRVDAFVQRDLSALLILPKYNPKCGFLSSNESVRYLCTAC